MKKKILITGGAGFIASHLIERIVNDHDIIIYDSFKRNALQYSGLANHPNITTITGDVLDAAALDKAMAGVDTCVHAAAIAGIYSVGDSIVRTMKVNFLGTYNALEAAKNNGVRKFIDFSTSEVYGPFVYRGKESDMTTQGHVGEKRWVYAVSKLAGEHLAHAYGSEHGFDVVTVRPFNVYGPRQVGEGAVQQMIRSALKNDPITVYNDGTQIRSWCYVADFAKCIHGLIDNNKLRGEVFNIGNPQATLTVLGLAKAIIRLTNSKSQIVFKAHPGPEVEMRVPDIAKLTAAVGFSPEVDMEEGLEKTIAWFRKQAI